MQASENASGNHRSNQSDKWRPVAASQVPEASSWVRIDISSTIYDLVTFNLSSILDRLEITKSSIEDCGSLPRDETVLLPGLSNFMGVAAASRCGPGPDARRRGSV